MSSISQCIKNLQLLLSCVNSGRVIVNTYHLISVCSSMPAELHFLEITLGYGEFSFFLCVLLLFFMQISKTDYNDGQKLSLTNNVKKKQLFNTTEATVLEQSLNMH